LAPQLLLVIRHLIPRLNATAVAFGGIVQREREKRWKALAAKIATEQDPDEFLRMVRDLHDLLEAEQGRFQVLPGSRSLTNYSSKE
jgi:hypothetical protein